MSDNSSWTARSSEAAPGSADGGGARAHGPAVYRDQGAVARARQTIAAQFDER